MPIVEVYFFRDPEKGVIPLLEWLYDLPKNVSAKCVSRLDRLAEMGHDLRRLEVDYLRDGIYELRASYQGVHYGMLYFFSGRNAVVISHGFSKEREIPVSEIKRAITRKRIVEARFERYTFKQEKMDAR